MCLCAASLSTHVHTHHANTHAHTHHANMTHAHTCSCALQLRAVVIRTIATLAFALLDDLRKLQALIICSCMTLMCWSFIRWVGGGCVSKAGKRGSSILFCEAAGRDAHQQGCTLHQ